MPYVYPKLSDEELIKEVYLANPNKFFSESQFITRFLEMVDEKQEHEEEIQDIYDEHESELSRVYEDLDDSWDKIEQLQRKLDNAETNAQQTN